jgi:hypothetical protein
MSQCPQDYRRPNAAQATFSVRTVAVSQPEGAHCWQLAYASKKAAKKALRRIQPRFPGGQLKRTFHCERCGCWHLALGARSTPKKRKHP